MKKYEYDRSVSPLMNSLREFAELESTKRDIAKAREIEKQKEEARRIENDEYGDF